MEYQPINTRWPFNTLEPSESFSTTLEHWGRMRSLAVYHRRKHGKRFRVNKVSETECSVTRIQ